VRAWSLLWAISRSSILDRAAAALNSKRGVHGEVAVGAHGAGDLFL
jgi:hypothetical protein